VFLREAITSVLVQETREWQMVVVDDGSYEDLSWVASVDARVRLVRQTNSGPAAARNRAVAESSGEYVAFLDADDLWCPDKLASQLSVLESSPDVGLCHSAFEQIDADGKPAGPGFGRNVSSYTDLLRGSAILTSSVMLRRECFDSVGGFDRTFRGREDYDFFLRVARRFPTQFIDRALVGYRLLPGSLSSDHARMFKQSSAVLRRHRNLAESDGNREAVSAADEGLRRLAVSYGCTRFDLARRHARERRWRRAASDLSAAFRWQPAYTSRSVVSWMMGARGGRSLPQA
jgi:glycosyltransferase involved in cell wall biosynthesis